MINDYGTRLRMLLDVLVRLGGANRRGVGLHRQLNLLHVPPARPNVQTRGLLAGEDDAGEWATGTFLTSA